MQFLGRGRPRRQAVQAEEYTSIRLVMFERSARGGTGNGVKNFSSAVVSAGGGRLCVCFT